jgi:hypothetical protein
LPTTEPRTLSLSLRRDKQSLGVTRATIGVVVETFDGSTARIPAALKLMNAYDNNQKAILKTLVRLKEVAENPPAPE